MFLLAFIRNAEGQIKILDTLCMYVYILKTIHKMRSFIVKMWYSARFYMNNLRVNLQVCGIFFLSCGLHEKHTRLWVMKRENRETLMNFLRLAVLHKE